MEQYPDDEQPIDSILQSGEGVYKVRYLVSSATADVINNFREIANTSVTDLTRRAIVMLDFLNNIDNLVAYDHESQDSIPINKNTSQIELDDVAVSVRVNIAEDVYTCLEEALNSRPSESISSLLAEGIHTYASVYAYAYSGYEIRDVNTEYGHYRKLIIFHATTDRLSDES